MKSLVGILIFAITTTFACSQALPNPNTPTNNIVPIGAAIGRYTLRQRGTALYNNGYIRLDLRHSYFRDMIKNANNGPYQGRYQAPLGPWLATSSPSTNTIYQRIFYPLVYGWEPQEIISGRYAPVGNGYGEVPPRFGSGGGTNRIGGGTNNAPGNNPLPPQNPPPP